MISDSPTKLNVLWICSDQQRADTLGCYGNQFTDTPYLDRLSRSGTTFDSAFCQSPECTPSRASFLTGRYPRNTGESDAPEREDIYCEYYNNWSNWVDHPVYSVMLRTNDSKIVSHALEEPGELYDLHNDPGELNNLWDDPASVSMRMKLQKRLCDRMAMTIDPLPPRQTKF